LILLGLAALGCGRRWLSLAAGLLLLGILAVALDYSGVASHLQAWLEMLSNGIRFGWEFKLSDAVFLFYGLAQFALLVVIVQRLFQSQPPPVDAFLGRSFVEHDASGMHGPAPSHRRVTMFLVMWLVMEILGYFMMTPFPAVRRVLGITVVASLLTGRLIAFSCPT
jgi:hypothetical protein